jgi:hypothetical protein
MQFTFYANCNAAERAARIRTLTFPEILSDPLVRLVMKADGVNPKTLEHELWDIAASLSPRETSISDCCAQAC